MFMRLTICGFAPLGYGPGPALPPSIFPTPIPSPRPSQDLTDWRGLEPDGYPLTVPIQVFRGSTMTLLAPLGQAYPTGSQVSAVIEQTKLEGGIPLPKRTIASVVHAEWDDPGTGLAIVRIGPTQLPVPLDPEIDQFGNRFTYSYNLVLRAIINGAARVVRDTRVIILPEYIVLPETP